MCTYIQWINMQKLDSGSKGKHTLNFDITALSRCYISLHPHSQCRNVSVSPQPKQCVSKAGISGNVQITDGLLLQLQYAFLLLRMRLGSFKTHIQGHFVFSLLQTYLLYPQQRLTGCSSTHFLFLLEFPRPPAGKCGQRTESWPRKSEPK